jgi:hypothetical protein
MKTFHTTSLSSCILPELHPRCVSQSSSVENKIYVTTLITPNATEKVRLLSILLITVLAMFICLPAFSQSKTAKIYKAVVTTLAATESYTGIIKEVQDSSITIVSDEGTETSIPSTSVKRIKIWRTGTAGRGVLVGGLAGAVVGSLIFLSNEEDPYAFIAIPLFAGIGAIIGGAGGAVSNNQNIKINGDQRIFQENAEVIRKYAQSSDKK